MIRKFTDNTNANAPQISTIDSNNNLISTEHLKELHNSGLSQKLIELNFCSLNEYEPHERLFYALPPTERRNDGRIRTRYLRRYQHIYKGGWWFSGVDLQTFELSEWGCFKPDYPRYDLSRKRQIKYEHPLKTNTRVFAPLIDEISANVICDRWGVVKPETHSPIDFWRFALDNTKIPLTITEGAKKAASLIGKGYLAIGLPGVWNGATKTGDIHALIPELLKFGENRQIYFAFDQDSNPDTVKKVNYAVSRTGYLLERLGASVRVLSWDKQFKGVDDLIFARGESAVEDAIEKSIDLPELRLQRLINLDSMVDLEVDRRYLGKLEIPETAQLIGIQSPKGTGKTETLSQIVRDANYNGTPVLILTHRIQLAKALCARFGVDHLEEIKSSPTGGVLGYGLCIDSFHPFSKARIRPEQWDEAIVIIDECEQVFWHLLNSSTCKQNRVKILKTLKETLQNVVATGGKIYLSDADLSPMAIQYVGGLIGENVEKYIVKNYYNPNLGKRELYVYDKQKYLVEAAIAQVQNDRKLYVACGAQRNSSTWGTQNLEKLISAQCPSKRVLRIDRLTLKDPKHPAYKCIEHLDRTVAEYDVVIASPTIETGVSIDIENHFDSVFCLASGVQTVDAVVQSVERVRADVPRHLFVPDRGLSFVGGRETTPSALLRTQEKIAQTNIRHLIAADLSDIEFDNLDKNFQQESLQYWARRACVVNSGMYRYKQHIIDKLLKEGYQLKDANEASDMAEVYQYEIKEIKTEAYEQEKLEISLKDSIEDKELKVLQEKYAKTTEEEQIERKAVLERKYNVEITPELIERDDKGWYSQLTLHYYLLVGRIFVEQRDGQKLKTLGDKDAGNNQQESENNPLISIFTPDANRDLLTMRIKTLEVLEIDQFFESDRTFFKSELRPWFEKIVKWRHEIKAILGVWISENSNPISAAQALLKKVGLRLTYLGRYGSRSNRETWYEGCNLNPDDRDRIFQQWLERDRKAYGDSSMCQAVS